VIDLPLPLVELMMMMMDEIAPERLCFVCVQKEAFVDNSTQGG
jgi:hypothetical protein